MCQTDKTSENNMVHHMSIVMVISYIVLDIFLKYDKPYGK